MVTVSRFFGRAGIAIFAVAVLLAAVATGTAPVRSQPGCAPNNAPCACSVECCGQQRCDGSVCNQCVAACLQRTAPTNNQFTALKAQCQTMIKQGFRRL